MSMNSLILRFAGPLQSWGTQSRFSVRDTGREPSKSGVVGILAAALGRPREADVRDLMQLRLAVRIDRDGTLRRDYQTAGGGRRPDGGDYGVAKANGGKPNTVTSSRYYLADADFRIAIESDDLRQLQTIAAALEQPVWPLFLGRKAYIPNPDLNLGIREDFSMAQALQQEPWFYRSNGEFKSRGETCRLRVVMDVEGNAGGNDVRTDITDSFASREFQLRHVTTDWITLPRELIQKDQTCFFHN